LLLLKIQVKFSEELCRAGVRRAGTTGLLAGASFARELKALIASLINF
jgi:hypothetical protein